MPLLYALIATFIVSLISLVGILTLGLNPKIFDRLTFILVGFAAGSLIGTAFLHLLAEAVDEVPAQNVFLWVILGFSLFFVMERFFYWRHCHEEKCSIHAFTYLNLLGDGLHNFTDGLIISAGFLTDFSLGIVTTLAVIFHELPQEMGDFAILVYGGFSKKKALLSNFICALTAVFGALSGYFISQIFSGFSRYVIPLVAGGFIYVASSDLIPELHKRPELRRGALSLLMFLAGIAFAILAKVVEKGG